MDKLERKRIDKQEKQRPDTIEKLIKYYNLERVWEYINKLIDYIDGKNNFSNKETVIGKYLGKPVYRKVIEFTPTEQTTYYDPELTDLETIVHAYGNYSRNSDDFRNPIPGNYINWECYFYNYSEHNFTLKFSDNAWAQGIKKCNIIFEYTKTID